MDIKKELLHYFQLYAEDARKRGYEPFLSLNELLKHSSRWFTEEEAIQMSLAFGVEHSGEDALLVWTPYPPSLLESLYKKITELRHAMFLSVVQEGTYGWEQKFVNDHLIPYLEREVRNSSIKPAKRSSKCLKCGFN